MKRSEFETDTYGVLKHFAAEHYYGVLFKCVNSAVCTEETRGSLLYRRPPRVVFIVDMPRVLRIPKPRNARFGEPPPLGSIYFRFAQMRYNRPGGRFR